MSDRVGARNELEELCSSVAGMIRLEAVMSVGPDQWVITALIPYDGSVMLVRCPSRERAMELFTAATAC